MDFVGGTKKEPGQHWKKMYVSTGDFKVIDELGNFLLLQLSEPKILFSSSYSSFLFPREFTAIRRFYTSDEPYQATLKFFFFKGDKIVENLLERIYKYTKWNEGFNFTLNIQPYQVDSYSELCDKILNALDVAGQDDKVIVGGVIGYSNEGSCENLFAKAKASSLINQIATHLININKIRSMLEECKSKKGENLYDCNAYKAYIYNNIVQLYAKAGGIPWIPGENLLQNTAVIGLATARMDREYVVGVAFAIAFLGKEIKSFLTTSTYNLNELDKDILKSKGIYIPRKTVEELLKGIVASCKKRILTIRRFVIFQTPIIVQEELTGISEVLRENDWFLVHVKNYGFPKRIYNTQTSDWGPYRGTYLLDKDHLDSFKDTGILKAVLATTGRAFVRSNRGEEEIPLYKATPRPIELEIHASRIAGSKPLNLSIYIGRLILLLNKLDWEAYTYWPKLPFVIKYAQRVATIISKVDEKTRNKLKYALSLTPELRYIM
uniref:Piwi domain-containing protein n=1 Tax=Thermofilum adornatum TaxID=1365176 RepID=A0A7C1GLZ9_9CREN